MALLLHTGLLLIPVYDTPAVVSSGQGVSVRIQNTTLQSSPNQIADHQAAKSPAVQESVPAEKQVNVAALPENSSTEIAKPSTEISESSAAIAKQSKPKPVQTQPVQTVNRTATTVVQNTKPALKKSVQPKPVTRIEAETLTTADNLKVQSSTANVVAAHKKTHLNEQDAVATQELLIAARPASNKKPKYPRRAIIRNQQGSVRVELLIKQDGFVEEATLLESSGFPLLDKSVLKYVNEERFIAALDKGLPVASTQLFTYRFILQ
ncbi:MAG: TonB family protein [Neptuniibacter sp.]